MLNISHISRKLEKEELEFLGLGDDMGEKGGTCVKKWH